MSKTAVVMLPFVLLLILWWRNRRLNWRDILASAPYFGLSVVFGLVTLWFQHHRAIAGDFSQPGGIVRRAAGAVVAFWFYLYKALLPLNLSFVYPQWDVPGILVVPCLLTIAAGVAMWRGWKSWGRNAAFGLGYFGLMVLPVLGFVDVYFHRYSLVADHWQYFSIIGVIGVVVAGVLAVGSKERLGAAPSLSTAERIPRNRGLKERKGRLSHPGTKPQASIWGGILPLQPLLGWFGIAGLVTLSVLSFQQAGLYRDAETLWQHTLKQNPKAWLALNNLGQIYAAKGRVDDAMDLYAAALRAKPEQVEGHNNLGAALLDLGKFDQAEEQFKAAIAVNPRFAMAYYNLGNVADRQGDASRATTYFRRALELDPEYPDAHNNLACMLATEGKVKEAIEHFREALRWRPDYVDALNNLGSTLTESGRSADARPFLEKALRLNPNYADAHHNLGNALLALDQRAAAITNFRTALDLNPGLIQARMKLGSLYIEDRQWDEAFRQYSIVVQMQPESVEAHYQLAVIQGARKQTAAAIEHFQAALRLNPDLVQAMSQLALIYATDADARVRNGAEAVRLATRAADLTNRKNPRVLDSLAAAEAEAGHFALAVATAELALDLARESGEKELPSQIEVRLDCYREKRPFRVTGPVRSRSDE